MSRAKPNILARINIPNNIYFVVNVQVHIMSMYLERAEYIIMNPIYEMIFKNLEKSGTIKVPDVLVFEYSGSIYCFECIYIVKYFKIRF